MYEERDSSCLAQNAERKEAQRKLERFGWRIKIPLKEPEWQGGIYLYRVGFTQRKILIYDKNYFKIAKRGTPKRLSKKLKR